ncbi:MAG TPA: glycosyltransferase family 4 protein [Longimicrobium sp.]|jgi:glycosyltransferase involved in cell wall biosynthesis
MPGAAAQAAPTRLLVVGEEHVRGKVARHYSALEAATGVQATFFVDDRSGITRQTSEQFPIRVCYTVNPRGGGASPLRYWRDFVRAFHAVRPHVLELYNSIHPFLLIPMAAYAAARGVPRVSIARGELIPELFDHLPTSTKRLERVLLRMMDVVIYKDFKVLDALRRECPGVPTAPWLNAIPVGPEPGYARDGNHVLFLNTFHPLRNLPVIVRAARRIRQAVPDAELHLVGGAADLAGRSPFFSELGEHEREVRALIDAEGVGGFVHIHPFTSEVAPHFARAKAYLFPADHVFCNYGLLEAMERGVPPIVSDQRDPDARRIVRHGENGMLVPITPEGVADAVVALLTDEPRRQEMARAARRTIEEGYDLSTRLHDLAEMYRSLAGGRGAPRPSAPAPVAARAEAPAGANR